MGALVNRGYTATIGLACFRFHSSYYSTNNFEFFFFRLKDREDEDEDEKRKEIQSWGKMKDEGVRAGCYSFDVFLIFF